MPFIRIKTGPNKGKTHEITNETLAVGRDIKADIRIEDQGVSRRHAEIFRVGEMFFLRDLASRNGTFVNEERCTEELLRSGDHVRIGSTVMIFEERAPTAEELRTSDSGRHFFTGSGDPRQTIKLDFAEREVDDDILEPPAQAGRESRTLSILIQLSRVIGSERRPDALMQQVAEMTARAVEAPHCYVFVRQGSSKEFALQASYASEGRAREAPPISKGIIRRVVKDGRAVLTTDAFSDDRFKENPSVFLKGIQSVICAPILARDDLIGVIYLAKTGLTASFEDEELEIATAIGVQAGLALQGIQSSQHQEKVYLDAVRVLVRASEMRDPRGAGHGERVARICAAIAGVLGLPEAVRRHLRLAALLHNAGKVALPDPELPPTRESRARQITLTVQLVRDMKGLEPIVPVIRNYRERMDGSGEPAGLAGDDIPLPARILGVADALDTLLTLGHHEQPVTIKEALRLVGNETPERFDPQVVDALIIAHRKGELSEDQPPPDETADDG